MIVGAWKTATIAKDKKASAEVDLGRPYETAVIAIPAITKATLTIQGSEKSGGTFYDLYTTDIATGNNKLLQSADGTGKITWIAPIGGIQYITLTAVNAQSAAVALRVQGVRS